MELLVLGVLSGVLASAFGGLGLIDLSSRYTGSDEDDLISGSDAGERVLALDGDDTVLGGGGSDVILLGDGDDVVDSGAGDDRVFGGAGDDLGILGTGDDLFRGEGGIDEVYGGAGNDLIDTVDYAFTDAADILSGGDGDDTLLGDDGDVMSGGAGTDAFTAWVDDALDNPVGITDFDPASERLVVEVDAAAFPAYDADDVTSDYDAGADVLTVYVGGYAVAELDGVDSLDPGRIEVRMV